MRPRIADLALLSDCQGAAVARRDGTVGWWCAPRFDSRPTLGALLDPDAGHVRLAPVGAPEHAQPQRRYLDDTLVVETRWEVDGGVALVRDALALRPAADGERLGQRVEHALVREVEGVEGSVDFGFEARPRLELGLVRCDLVREDDGALRTAGGPDTVLVHATGVALEEADDAARARFAVRAGERVGFALVHREGWEVRDVPRVDPHRALEETVEAWRAWVASHERYDGFAADAVHLGALVVQGLTYAPTGAIVAAATTSLPEVPGGESNWDYCYAWLRDVSLTLRALRAASCLREAERYLTWMARCGHEDGDPPQVVFGVGGERDLTEHRRDELAGFDGAQPVRIGNAAWRQTQMDVPGEVLDAAFLLRDDVDRLEPFVQEFLRGLADCAAERWREDDHGIWENREGRDAWTHSKVLCWVALDRACRMGDELDAAKADLERWARERDAVREAVLRDAWVEDEGVFCGLMGKGRLDASVLIMPIVGFLDAADPRMRSTIEALCERLEVDGLIHRWEGSEDEGSFVIASFWMVECLALAGELDRARALFERAAGRANDLGLLSECAGPDGRMLGNVPQVFSHVGLMNAAWCLDRVTEERGDRVGAAG